MSVGNSESAAGRTLHAAHLSDDDLAAIRRLLGFGIYRFSLRRLFLDHFRLSATLQDAPDGIDDATDGALVEPSEILLVPGAKVTAVEVLSFEDPAEGDGFERVKYDCAIRFYREDGRHFCVTA